MIALPLLIERLIDFMQERTPDLILIATETKPSLIIKQTNRLRQDLETLLTNAIEDL